MKYFKMRV